MFIQVNHIGMVDPGDAKLANGGRAPYMGMRFNLLGTLTKSMAPQALHPLPFRTKHIHDRVQLH